MTEAGQKRNRMIEHLEAALVLADDLGESVVGYLIETALDEARALTVDPLRRLRELKRE